MEAEGIEVDYAPIDEFYVHIDLMVCMLAEKLAAVCLDTTDPEIVKWLESKGIEIVPVSFRETMALGCNVVALGNDRVLSVDRGAGAQRAPAGARLHVYDPDMSQFLWPAAACTACASRCGATLSERMGLSEPEQRVCDEIERAARRARRSSPPTLIAFDTTAREPGDPPREERALQEYLASG